MGRPKFKWTGSLRPARVGPERDLPDSIPKTDYYDRGIPMSEIQSPQNKLGVVKEWEGEGEAGIREACRIGRLVLDRAHAAINVGVTTDHIDEVVHNACIELGAYPSPLHYYDFPKSVCTSVNEVICHGIPDSRPLQDGDICNIDVTGWTGGVHGDTNATFFVGEVDPESRQLVKVTEECMWLGIEAARAGRPLSDIGRAIEDHAKQFKYGVVRAFVGHGIGEQFHTDIQVLHYYDSRASVIIRPGMTFTIEPMITLGTINYKIWDDDWTAVTSDGKRTAQFEHTILITDGEPEVLTGGEGATSGYAPWKR
ncbi:MAG: type I methionyl aminopeptidase [Ilumatobacter sp.]|nr:type I methionyl aminopeptidase [Ilumatobacter sp.]